MSTHTDEPRLEQIGEEPQLELITHELDTSLRDSGIYLEQYRYDYATRFCLWEGQSRDGRKWDKEMGGKGKARPWDGASDVRTFTADEIIGEQKELMMLAWYRSRIQATPLQTTDSGWSTKVATLLQFMLREQMSAETARELELAADWRQTYGVAAMGVWWDQQRRVHKVPITLEEMVANARRLQNETGSQAGMELVQQVLDPVQEEFLIERLLHSSPVLDRQGARKLLRDLRTNGKGLLPQVYVAKNQPCWEALRVFVDVFFPIETSSFDKDCRWIARRRWLTETDLKEKVLAEGWDEEWCREVMQHKGDSYSITEAMRELAPRLSSGSLTDVHGQPNAENYVEVFDFYLRGIDQETGYPTLHRTILSPHVKDSYARHEPIRYDHGRLPFVEMVRERIERQMLESRSVPEIAGTFQNTIKSHRDMGNDAAQMSTIPTLIVPMWRSLTPVSLGPAAQIPERTSGELRFLQPQTNTSAERMEERTEVALARYFGRSHAQVPADRQQRASAFLVTTWLGEVREAARMTLELAQQYMDDVSAMRRVGPMQVPFHVSREEIQGGFNLQLEIDPNDLNFDLAIKKLEALNKFVLPIDTQGAINRATLVSVAARMIDPHLADATVASPELAAQGEVEDEKKNLVSILSGVEPPMRAEGQNFALRLQVLQQELAANPLLPQVIAMRPDVQAMLQARMEHLAFQAQQFGPNAQIGRVGAQPGLETLQGEMQKATGI